MFQYKDIGKLNIHIYADNDDKKRRGKKDKEKSTTKQKSPKPFKTQKAGMPHTHSEAAD